MFSASLSMLPAAITNGLMYGAIYALVALGLTPVSYTHLTLPTTPYV